MSAPASQPSPRQPPRGFGTVGRGNETKQEHETIERERVEEATLYKEPSRLVPAWIERDPTGAARQLINQGRAIDRQVLEPQLEPSPEFGRDVHADPKVGVGRLKRIFELRVEKALIPE